jgi:hypothetical protein
VPPISPNSSSPASEKENHQQWIEVEEKKTSSFGRYRSRMMGTQNSWIRGQNVSPREAAQE